jgi:hypothetical protein
MVGTAAMSPGSRAGAAASYPPVVRAPAHVRPATGLPERWGLEPPGAGRTGATGLPVRHGELRPAARDAPERRAGRSARQTRGVAGTRAERLRGFSSGHLTLRCT